MFVCFQHLLGDSGVDEIELNVEKISELGNTDVLLSTISRLALALSKCGVDVRGMKELERNMLPSNSSAKCMDGTNAGYYIRKREGSNRWLVFLDGGYYCFDKRSCRARSENTRNLTSSAHWSLTKEGTGILSWNPEENPFLFSANIVYVPYCSSDAWSGNNTKNGLHFMGANIVDEVIKDLYRHGLKSGEKLFFAGSSAGATGVLLNIDRVADRLAKEAPGLDVQGIVDSGWFLDTEQLHKTECTNTLNCPPAEAVQKGFRFWKSEIPKRCKRAYADEPWRCFFGYRIYPFIKTPLFVIAYLYDRAQILASMGGGLGVYQQVQQDSYTKHNTKGINYMRDLAKLMNNTLSNVSAVFAPSCMDHELLQRSKWHSVAVKGVTLIEALRCWEGSQETTNRPRQAQLPPYPWSTSSFEVPDLSELEDIASEEAVTNDIRHFSRKLDKERRRSRRNKKKKKQRVLKKNRKSLRLRREITSEESEAGIGQGAESVEQLLANALQSNSLRAYANQQQSQCQYQLFDECTTPNCNLLCPSYINLFSTDSSNQNKNPSYYNADISDIERYIDDPDILDEIISRQS
ncbi:NOTUM [Bugula neritina]|uniref:NOTUM n=1 Tax=Bugula neritina TaxID=10212 RepID=A0A7J7K1T7_BUGNE|nr:NOTUM [Bugula neritina]